MRRWIRPQQSAKATGSCSSTRTGPVTPADETPPVEVMVGGWRLEEDRELGPFRPNPGYRPPTPNTPSDPIDALLRLVATGEDRGDRIIPTLTRTVVEIACDDQNQRSRITSRSPIGLEQLVIGAGAFRVQLSRHSVGHGVRGGREVGGGVNIPGHRTG